MTHDTLSGGVFMQSKSNGSQAILRIITCAGAIVCVVLTLLVIGIHGGNASLKPVRAYAEPNQTISQIKATEDTTATIKFAQDVYIVSDNSSITVDLIVVGASNSAGWEAVLVYNPAFLTPTQVTPGAFLSGSGRTQDVLGPRETIPGRLLIGSSTHGTALPVNGSGVLAHITFNVLATGRTLVTIDNGLLVALPNVGIVEVQPTTVRGTEIVHDSPLAVVLAHLDATSTGSGVALTWETVSEIDNLGFDVYRNSTPSAPGAQQVFVPSLAPGNSQGASYQWLDTNVSPGSTYFYWLENVSTGGIATRHGPIGIEYQSPTAVKLTDLVVDRGATLTHLWWWVTLACIAVVFAGGVYSVWKHHQRNL
jgi:hypothetical protein